MSIKLQLFDCKIDFDKFGSRILTLSWYLDEEHEFECRFGNNEPFDLKFEIFASDSAVAVCALGSRYDLTN